MGSDHDFYGPLGRYRSDHISQRKPRLSLSRASEDCTSVKGIAAMSSLATVGLVETEHEPSGRFVVRTKRSKSD
jgi:hypothetical protein